MAEGFKPLLAKLVDGRILSADEAHAFFAACLRGRGVKAVTINWGYWGEVGVVSDPALRARLERQGRKVPRGTP